MNAKTSQFPFAPGVIDRVRAHESRRHKVLTALLCFALLAIVSAVLGFSAGYFNLF